MCEKSPHPLRIKTWYGTRIMSRHLESKAKWKRRCQWFRSFFSWKPSTQVLAEELWGIGPRCQSHRIDETWYHDFFRHLRHWLRSYKTFGAPRIIAEDLSSHSLDLESASPDGFSPQGTDLLHAPYTTSTIRRRAVSKSQRSDVSPYYLDLARSAMERWPSEDIDLDESAIQHDRERAQPTILEYFPEHDPIRPLPQSMARHRRASSLPSYIGGAQVSTDAAKLFWNDNVSLKRAFRIPSPLYRSTYDPWALTGSANCSEDFDTPVPARMRLSRFGLSDYDFPAMLPDGPADPRPSTTGEPQAHGEIPQSTDVPGGVRTPWSAQWREFDWSLFHQPLQDMQAMRLSRCRPLCGELQGYEDADALDDDPGLRNMSGFSRRTQQSIGSSIISDQERRISAEEFQSPFSSKRHRSEGPTHHKHHHSSYSRPRLIRRHSFAAVDYVEVDHGLSADRHHYRQQEDLILRSPYAVNDEFSSGSRGTIINVDTSGTQSYKLPRKRPLRGITKFAGLVAPGQDS